MFSSGAMFGAQASQGFVMDTQPGNLALESSPKKPRQDVKETCLPVTIRAVEVAFQQRGETGEDLKFYGSAEPQMVIVVAAVESVVRQAASLEVMLNDGTARIKARYFVMDKSDELDRIVAGSYVSAFGEVRAAPVQHLSLKGMRLVESADEVSYHMIEVAHAALQLQKHATGYPKDPATPSKAASKDEAILSAEQFTPQKPGTATVANSASVAATADLPPAVGPALAMDPAEQAAVKLQQDVPMPSKQPAIGVELRAAALSLLRDAAVGPEGLHLDVIMQKVGGSGDEVRSIITELVDDGELYSTITEAHFAAL